jgi:hypothetical protein
MQQTHIQAPSTVRLAAGAALGGSRVVRLILFLSLPPFTREMSEDHAAGATSAQHAGRDQELRHVLISIFSAFGKFIVAVFVLTFGFTALAHEVAENHAPCTSSPQDSRCNQHLGELTILALPIFRGILVTDFVVVVRRLIALAEQVSQYEFAQAGATQQAATNQQARNALFLVAALVGNVLVIVIKVVICLRPFTDEASEHATAHAPAPDCATAYQSREFLGI